MAAVNNVKLLMWSSWSGCALVLTYITAAVEAAH